MATRLKNIWYFTSLQLKEQYSVYFIEKIFNDSNIYKKSKLFT